MPESPHRESSNFILAHMDEAGFRLIEGELEDVALPVRKVLERAGRRIDNIYFPESGFASVVAGGGKPIEVGIIGREGMTGIAIVLGDDRPQNETFMQVGGKGQRLATIALRAAMDASRPLHRSMLKYAHSFLQQTANTALANGICSIEERLARWLMADDRIEGDVLPLTHEFMAMMLAVRRPGVTVAIQALERRGLISRRRGAIVIRDRQRLDKLSKGTYTPLPLN